ncbi:MAG: IS66 family transposase [Planctomycetota bacterium]
MPLSPPETAELPISLGTVCDMEAEVTQALEALYREAGEAVRAANAKQIDETSWKDRKQRAWLWGARANAIAFFVIHGSRGSSDRWVAYTLQTLVDMGGEARKLVVGQGASRRALPHLE